MGLARPLSAWDARSFLSAEQQGRLLPLLFLGGGGGDTVGTTECESALIVIHTPLPGRPAPFLTQ